ncbi:Inosine-uridine preferring nucleoside hydrolase [Trichoplax sp. H2]|nr:Inosine-uridine preferring nucleoside hydrolase [Trichoplax sp. H2]|eukprot:RDD40024.1 Inosine-uridine preferring nucleoside hydrolase [Trichoplax sp. H2]
MGCHLSKKVYRYHNVSSDPGIKTYSRYEHPKEELLPSMLKSDKKWLIIDTDAGIDSALAILLALHHDDVGNILAITCVNGIVTVDQAVKNVVYVLNICDCDTIPIYKGSDRPLVGDGLANEPCYNGQDGLGDIHDRFDSRLFYNKIVRSENAINIMVSLASRYEGKISLIALGPLTNLALACKVNRNFPRQLRDLTILGGRYYPGLEDALNSKESNFLIDPEAAHIVLKEYPLMCPTRIINGETVVHHPINFQWTNDVWLKNDTKKSGFVEQIVSKALQFYRRRDTNGYYVFDPTATAVAIDPHIVIGATQIKVEVNLRDPDCRGHIEIKLQGSEEDGNLLLVQNINVDVLKDMLWNTVK